MERSKRDLEALVASQKEQLTRYEKRLKDVVTAYKGLLKEKEALEMSLAVTANPTVGENITDTKSDDAISTVSSESKDFEDKGQLQTQLLTLMNSLATLSAEKSRMEASFQADKKQLRAQLDQKDKTLAELQTKMKENAERTKVNIEEIKAKLIIERQEHEKESNNQVIMIRELQKLYADERHLKESIEMQLNNFKTQFASNEAENIRVRELQTQLKEANALLKELQGNNKQGSNAIHEDNSSKQLLKQLQVEMQLLKDQHANDIKKEQRRALQAEEQSRYQAALHEDRVANLEERLAELSSSVGTYDRLRSQDQESIQSLKKKLQELERNSDSATTAGMHHHGSIINNSHEDVGAIVDEIVRLKKILMQENVRAANPSIDLTQVFTVGADHTECQAELKRAEKYYEDAKLDISKLQDKIQMQKSHIRTLQDKVKVLNRNIDEQDLELKHQNERLRQAVKEERAKWKSVINGLENENRYRINELEQQLQKQRQRSLQLLEEKEQEIKTLQTSFEVFHSIPVGAETKLPTNISEREQNASSDCESTDDIAANNKLVVALKPKKLSLGENSHMIHFANELARNNITIANLRKAKYEVEGVLRKVIQDKVALCEKIDELEEEVDRLERCKTREGANLEYLKNVIISFISSKNPDGKRHMMNAISAVLELTPSEIQTINAAFQKK